MIPFISSAVHAYVLTTNLLVGLLCWIAFRWIGLDNAGAWATAACGHLLGVPIVVILKVVSQHLEPMHPIAELLGV